jgi:murein DD-endopeptidase MepM/ murein hydrolase activator NlpD
MRRHFGHGGRGRTILGGVLIVVLLAAVVALRSGLIVVERGGPAPPDSVTSPMPRASTGDVVPRPDSTAPPAALPAPPPAPVPAPSPSKAILDALRSDTLVAPADAADTMEVAPTPAELAELSAALTIPVQGIHASELLDTFDAARGDTASPRRHDALDIPAPRGTPVLSAADGRLLRLFTSAAGGLMIYAADPSEHFVLLYAHLDRYATGLREGMPLRRGQVIGYVGTTGNAPPNVPHLHFGISRTKDVKEWWTGRAIDPKPLLTAAAH